MGMKKNEEQADVIATFNNEILSLKEDITILNKAQKVSRDKSEKYERAWSKEKANREIQTEKVKTLEIALKRALSEKQDANERLKQFQLESFKVQQNLQQAQSWFKAKCDTIQNEVDTSRTNRQDKEMRYHDLF